MRDPQRVFVIDARVRGPPGLVGRQERVEQTGWRAEPRPLPGDEAGGADIGRRRVGREQIGEVPLEGGDERQQLGVGMAVVAIDEGRRQVERIEREIMP